MRTPCGVVFDLDGTLVDSMPLVLRAFRHAVEPWRPDLTVDELLGSLGGPSQACLRQLLGSDDHLEPSLVRLEAFVAEHGADLKPFPSAARILRDLRRRGVAVGVWTGRDRASSELILHREGLYPLVDTVVCGDDFPSHKPNPEGLLAILARWQLAAGAVLLLGDSDLDVLGGSACGVSTLLICHDRTPGEQIASRCHRSFITPEEAYRFALDWIDSAGEGVRPA